MAAKQDNSAQIVQIKGRLSYPAFTHKEALALNDRSDPQYKKSDPAEVKPTYSLLLTQTEWEKLKAHLINVFLPWCVEQEKEKGRSGLTAAQAKKLTRIIEAEDWEVDKIPGFLRPVSEKSADLAPECVVDLRVGGRKGRDIELKAVVKDVDALRNPLDEDGDPLVIPQRGAIFPIEDTKIEMYPGAFVGTQLNLYAYLSASEPRIIATGETAIFLRDMDRFGGSGAPIDEDVFLDDDDD